MRRFRLAAVALTAFACAAAPVMAQDDKADPAVQYRIAVMEGIGENANAIGLVMRHNLPQTQNLGLHAEVIARSARAALSAFEPKVAGGAAKPEVWNDWKDFSTRLTQLAAAADEVAAAASTGGPDAAKAKLNPMFAACKSCHDIYKTKK